MRLINYKYSSAGYGICFPLFRIFFKKHNFLISIPYTPFFIPKNTCFFAFSDANSGENEICKKKTCISDIALQKHFRYNKREISNCLLGGLKKQCMQNYLLFLHLYAI
jgi:hypothetical protein